ncbi:MAG: PD40 domain-containing protein [Deltaproteobacteria bacterium]|nr:PD40 domain-containing protein [Deltaproteobacteria bacterium]
MGMLKGACVCVCFIGLNACTRVDSGFRAPGDLSLINDVDLDLGLDMDLDLGLDMLPSWPTFTTPVLFNDLNTDANEHGPHLSTDGLRLYFTVSHGGGDEDLHLSTRGTLGAPFGPPVALLGVNLPSAADRDISLTHDELWMVMERQEEGDVRRLFWSSRETVDQAFATPQPLMIDDDDRGHDPFISPDGLTLVFAADRGEVGNTDLYLAQRMTIAAPFSGARLIQNANSEAAETGPMFVGSWLLFSSNRPGCVQGKDLFIATLDLEHAQTDEPRCAGVSSIEQDEDPFLHLGTHVLIFSKGTEMWVSSF